MWRPTSLGLVVLLAGCGDDAPAVEITEAPPVAERPALAPPAAEPDTLFADSLLADSLRADTVRAAAPAAPEPDPAGAGPDFNAFWLGFQAAVRSGNVDAVTRHAVLRADGIGLDDVDEAYVKAFTEPFKGVVLGLSPRDFRRDGSAREVRVVVGYDGQGEAVPEDEAVEDEAVRLRFDVVGDRYRWVGFRAEG